MKIAFVAPLYGEEILGGAEIIGKELAEVFTKSGMDVEVLTTCANEHHAVEDYYSEGESIINGVKIRRFKISRPNLDLYLEITGKIIFLYIFSWENVLDCDKKRLLDYLKKDLDMDWAEDAEIKKSDDDKSVYISKGDFWVEIILNEKRESAVLKSNNGRNIKLFTRYDDNNNLLNILSQFGKLDREAEKLWIKNSLNSDDLYEYIEKNKDEYDYFLFYPYLRGTTYFGSRICPEKSILIPFLHDEGFAYLSIFKEMFEKHCKGIVFHSPPEMELAKKIYDLQNKAKKLIGFGFDLRVFGSETHLRDRYGICDEYILYSGRIEYMKNIQILINYFEMYKQKNPNRRINLVLVGDKGADKHRELPMRDDIINIGCLPYKSQDLADVYAGALFLCQPSVNESFSIVIMESWLQGRPVLVHENCEVTKNHCLMSNGGLWFKNYDDFEECVNFYLNNPAFTKKIGIQGMNYVKVNYNWNRIINKYKDFLTNLEQYEDFSKLKIACIINVFTRNDAVGNNLINKTRLFKEYFSNVKIYPELFENGLPYDIKKISQQLTFKEFKYNNEIQKEFYDFDIYIYDFPTYYPFIETIKNIKNDKIIIFDYHGVTPPALWGSKQGIEAFKLGEKKASYVKYADYVIVHSRFMKQYIQEKYGFDAERIYVLPYAVPIEHFKPLKKNPQLIKIYNLEGNYILLYVGRMAGNKRIDLLVRGLAKIKDKIPNVKLLLVGDYDPDPYKEQIEKTKKIASELSIRDDVIFVGKVPHERLCEYYNLCDIYVTTSLHEGFCIPLIEAMACGKPVIGSNCTAIPETMGNAGLTFEPKNVDEFSEKIIELLSDESKRKELSDKGVKRAKDYTLEIYSSNLNAILNNILQFSTK